MVSGQAGDRHSVAPLPLTMLTLKHLNEDTSWLISFTFGGSIFNILVDPWCVGTVLI